MSGQPDVSVVIAVGGDAGSVGLAGLQHSIGSIGDDPLVEILVVLGGGAPGGAAEWLWARAAADPRLILLGEGWFGAPGADHDGMVAAPRGMAWARNFGIAAAAAPLVAFLDPGDVWLPGKLGGQRALHAGHPSLGFSFTDSRPAEPACADDTSMLAAWPRFGARHGGRTAPFLLGADTLAQLLAEDVVVASTVVARTDLLRQLGGFPTDRAESARDLWLRLAACAPVACRPEARVAARRRPAATAPRPAARLQGIAGDAAARIRVVALRLAGRLAASPPRPA